MRYINNSHLPRLANLHDIDAANGEIGGLDEEARNNYIDDHYELWSALKPALWALGSCKCWYSEAVIQEQEGQVEHFRPKKRLWGAQHKGYWWRAFDWTNLRLAHPTVNLRVTDYLTKEKAGKGAYFPLRDPEQRATTEADEGNEVPVLLDPANPEDCKLLCFDSNNGKPVPRYSPEEDEWRHERAARSIEYYHLDEGTWNYKRKDLMDEIGVLCDVIIDCSSTGPHDQERLDVLIGELSVYLEPLSEFTSAAWQVVREKGIIEQVIPLPA